MFNTNLCSAGVVPLAPTEPVTMTVLLFWRVAVRVPLPPWFQLLIWFAILIASGLGVGGGKGIWAEVVAVNSKNAMKAANFANF